MDDLARKLAELLGYKLPEQQTSPHWIKIRELLDEAFVRGFNAGRASVAKQLADAKKAEEF
jgi:hypothetical protein